jgi:hypothetical protein
VALVVQELLVVAVGLVEQVQTLVALADLVLSAVAAVVDITKALQQEVAVFLQALLLVVAAVITLQVLVQMEAKAVEAAVVALAVVALAEVVEAELFIFITKRRRYEKICSTSK